LFTTDEALSAGLTMDALRWGVRSGRWRRVVRGVYADGPEDLTLLDKERARVMACPAAAARGLLAGVLYDLDSVALARCPVHRGRLSPERVVPIDGVRCADGTQTMVDLAASLDDLRWEQALESALRKRLTTIAELEAMLDACERRGPPGTARIRRVLALRPPGAPPTESLLETFMVQLARLVPGLGDPVRQFVVRDEHGVFVARVDLAWPELGLFLELDGEQHKGQPRYDANRQTAVIVATGWLVGRFTWTEVVHFPTPTRRRLVGLLARCLERTAA